MKIAVLDTRTLGSDIDLSEIERIGEVEYFESMDKSEVGERLVDKDILVTNKVRLDRENLSKLENLKLICLTATGYNNVDIEYTNSRGIVVCNVAGYSTDSVVQHTFTMLLYLIGKIDEKDKYVKSKGYTKSKDFTNLDNPFKELAGMKWGVVGLGNIGKKVSNVASCFGAEVYYYSTSGRNKDDDYPSVSMDKLLKESDIISVHCPLNDKTRGLIGKESLKKMKKDAIVINVARGGIVIEEDLVDALNKNIIGGACLDVFSSEPLEEDSVIYDIEDMDKVVLTPHIAWGSIEARKRLVKEVILNIEKFIEGEPRNVVKPL